MISGLAFLLDQNDTRSGRKLGRDRGACDTGANDGDFECVLAD